MSYKTKQCLSLLLIVLIVLTLMFIWGNSLKDRTESAEISNGLLDYVKPLLQALGIPTEDDHALRKLAHFGEFGLLGAEISLLFLLQAGLRRKTLCLSVLVCILVAAVDETIQLYSGRACQLSDVLLDASGSICAIGAVYLISLIIQRRRVQQK